MAGTVHDPVGQPVTSAAISLISAAGASLDRTVTDRQGAFVLPVAPTARMIQIRRIGFLPVDMPVPDSAHAVRVMVAITMHPIPHVLDPIVVVDATCPRNNTAGEAAAFWGQAQAGFLASVVAREAAPADANLLHVLHTMNARDELVRTTIDAQHSVATRPIIAARSPESFATRGYVQDSVGERFFYGPDADVLADASFQQTHCFTMAKVDRAHAGEIGIAFAPANGREKVSDIAGVLWLDRTPLALRDLEFRYTGVDPAVESAHGGGHLSFRTADNGIIVVGEYDLRMPEVQSGPDRLRMGLAGTTRSRPGANVVDAVHTSGGVLLAARWPDGTILKTSLPSVTGRVTDATTDKGIPNVDVAIPWTPYHTRSGLDGAFTLTDVLPGEYPVTATDSSFAAFGIVRSRGATIQLDSAQHQARPVALPLDTPMAAAVVACGSNQVGNGHSIMAIRIVDSSGAVVRSPMEIAYQNLSVQGVLTSVSGKWPFVLCGATMGLYAFRVREPVAGPSRGRDGQAHLNVSGRAEIDTVTIVLGPPGRGGTD